MTNRTKWLRLSTLLIAAGLLVACGGLSLETTTTVDEAAVESPEQDVSEAAEEEASPPTPEPESVEEAGDGGEGEATGDGAEDLGPDRGDILAAMDQAIENLTQNPTSDEARLELANLLYQAGYFQDARANLQPLSARPDAPVEALTLMGELEYLLGNYDEAEEVLLRAAEAAGDDVAAQIGAQVKLMFVYYQTNQFSKSHELMQGT